MVNWESVEDVFVQKTYKDVRYMHTLGITQLPQT